MNKAFEIKKILLVFISVFVLASCGRQPEENAALKKEDQESNTVEVTQAQIQTSGIALGRIEQKQISGTIRVNGVLDVPPQQLISISAPLGGFVKETELLQGSRVKKGQVIAVVENLDFIQMQQDYLEAKNQYEFATADYHRQQGLAAENVNSEKVLQQSKTNYVTWQGKYNALREKLKVLNVDIASVEQGNFKSTINLYSPISGYVTNVNVNMGKFVNPVDVLFTIVDTEHLHAELTIFEKDVPKIKIGQKVRFTLANEMIERIATVYLIGREISLDRTIRIHCHLDKEDKDLLPGMYLTASIETGGAMVSALPDEAVIDYDGRKYIFVASSNKASKENADGKETNTFLMIEIETGSKELGYTEVKLPPTVNINSEIAVKGAYALLSKMKNTEEAE